MTDYPIKYQGQTYTVHHKPPTRRNKHLRLSVHRDGRITLSTPINPKQADIKHFLQHNAAWIAEQVKQSEQRRQQATAQALSPENPYRDGSRHYLLGNPFTLRLAHFGTNEISNNTLYLSVQSPDPKHVQQALWHFYRQYALEYLPQRLSKLLPQTPWVNTAPQIKVRRMKRQWGNCAHRGHLTFNTHLIKAPSACVDCVIIHELCHLQAFNHSPRFYALMDSAMPDWRTHDQHLRQLTPALIDQT